MNFHKYQGKMIFCVYSSKQHLGKL